MIVRERSYEARITPAEKDFAYFWLVSYCVLVGGSERFIIRSCARWLGKVNSVKLRIQLKACFQQEANHAVTHDAFLQQVNLGLPSLGAFVQVNNFVCFKLLEKMFPEGFRLAAAAAMEQLNTCIAIEGLKHDLIPFESGEFGRMLNWHYVEEIEHREVVFDLMQEAGVGLLTRISAAAMIYVNFSFWISAGALLSATNSHRGFRGLTGFLFTKEAILGKMLQAAGRFCLPGYHPRQELLPERFVLLGERV